MGMDSAHLHVENFSTPSPDLSVLLPLSLQIKTSAYTEIVRQAFRHDSSILAGDWYWDKPLSSTTEPFSRASAAQVAGSQACAITV